MERSLLRERERERERERRGVLANVCGNGGQYFDLGVRERKREKKRAKERERRREGKRERTKGN